MSVMLLKNQWSRLGLVGVFILTAMGCASTPGAGGRMQPLPGATMTQADQTKGHGYGGDDDSKVGFVDWFLGKKPQKTAPPYQNTAQGMTPNGTGIQQVAAVGPAGGIGQPHQASAIPANTVGQVDGLVGESVEAPKWWDLSQFSPTEISDGFKATFGLDPNEDRARTIYRQGISHYKQKQYSAAASRFKRAAARWPDSLLEEKALFYQGESHFFADEYTSAQDAFGGLLKKHGNTRYLDTVSKRLFAIGHYWEKAWTADPHWPVTPNLTDKTRPRFDTWGYGIKAFEIIAMNDPTGPLADDSLMALANAYFRRNRYLDAADYYDRVRTDYPKSNHLVDAHILAMKSHEMNYQGAQYDNTPLKKADKIAETLLTQFGRQLGKEREEVVKSRNRIRAKLAEQDWVMAKHYEGKGQYGSARFYYQEIIKEYPGTPIAKSSYERMGQIKEKPAKTVNKFQALVDLLDPEDDPLAEINASKRSNERVAQKKAPLGFLHDWFETPGEKEENPNQEGLWR